MPAQYNERDLIIQKKLLVYLSIPNKIPSAKRQKTTNHTEIQPAYNHTFYTSGEEECFVGEGRVNRFISASDRDMPFLILYCDPSKKERLIGGLEFIK